MTHAYLSLRDRFDRVGIVLSGMCAVHCVLGIVLVSALGLGGELLLSPGIHQVGLVIAVVVGALSLGLGLIRHGRPGPLAVGVAGLALMAAAVAIGHGLGEALLTIAGVLLVAIAHLSNLRHAS